MPRLAWARIFSRGKELPLLHRSYRNNTSLIGPMYQARIEDCSSCADGFLFSGAGMLFDADYLQIYVV